MTTGTACPVCGCAIHSVTIEVTERIATNYTERATHVLTAAKEEARRFNHNYVSTEHLLLALAAEGESAGWRCLTAMADVGKIRSAVEFIIGRGTKIVTEDVGLTPRAQNVIGLALAEARNSGAKQIGTEHILLGLVREGEGIAAGVLESIGVDLVRTRAAVKAVLG